MDAYETDLDSNPANFAPLSPVRFLEWAAITYPSKTAIIDGDRRSTYREFARRSHALALAIGRLGLGRNDTVSVIIPNVTAMLDAHNGVLLAGAVLNTINLRLEADTVRYILGHGECQLLLIDQSFLPLAEEALVGLEIPAPKIVVIKDDTDPNPIRTSLPHVEYEAFLDLPPDPLAGGKAWSPFEELREGEASFAELLATNVANEFQASALGYTSGTTARPKGVVYDHRGCYLNAVGNALSVGLSPETGYLWTLPMFHCNGWTYTWSVTMVGGTHICLRKLSAETVFLAIDKHDITHLCAAPVVLTMLIHAPEEVQKRPSRPVRVCTGGAAPATAIIEGIERLNFNLLHTYGLTETYGPAIYCFMQDEWAGYSAQEKSAEMARQGTAMVTLASSTSRNIETGEEVPADTTTIGEIALRGNIVMRGYLKDPEATKKAFQHGYFFSGDLAVRHPDNYLQIKDRSKDIIISGGENVSSLEIEEVLFRHPDVIEAAVVAKAHDHWGETPCAFVTLREGAACDPVAMTAHCQHYLAGFKVPKHFVPVQLPKTSTGKIQKFKLREWAKDVT